MLMERLEIVDQGSQIFPRQGVLRHQDTGLVSLWIDNPAGQLAADVRKCACAERGATGEVGQIGPDGRARRSALDAMTNHTSRAEEDLPAMRLLRRGGFRCGLALCL